MDAFFMILFAIGVLMVSVSMRRRDRPDPAKSAGCYASLRSMRRHVPRPDLSGRTRPRRAYPATASSDPA